MDKDDDQKEGETKGAQKSKDGVDAVGRAASANLLTGFAERIL